MPLEFEDRVKDQTQTTGTGTVTIDGVAPAGYRTISAAHSSGSTVRYTIINGLGTEWEVGQGVWTAGANTLTRATVYASSNANALVNFSAGSKVVFTGLTAQDIMDLAPKASPSFTGVALFGGAVQETRVAVAASAIDLSLGNYFSKTISGVTTFTVSNVPSSGTAASFILDLTNGGSSTVNWWTGVKWAGGTAPTLTAAGRDVLGFFTHDGGTTWTGLVLGKDVK